MPGMSDKDLQMTRVIRKIKSATRELGSDQNNCIQFLSIGDFIQITLNKDICLLLFAAITLPCIHANTKR